MPSKPESPPQNPDNSNFASRRAAREADEALNGEREQGQRRGTIRAGYDQPQPEIVVASR